MDSDVVLIPGALATFKLWHYQVPLFNQKIHIVDVLNSDSITEMAQRFVSLAPKKFTLIGFSMGGYVSLELYRLIPEQIDKLILINSGPSVVSPKGRKERERSLDLINHGKFEFLVKLIFKSSIYDTKKHGDLLPLIEEMAFDVGAENYRKQLNAILNKPDHSSLLQSIQCPTLLIASKNDTVMSIRQSEHMVQEIKNSQLVYIEQCGHIAMLEQPEILNRILASWLSP